MLFSFKNNPNACPFSTEFSHQIWRIINATRGESVMPHYKVTTTFRLVMSDEFDKTLAIYTVNRSDVGHVVFIMLVHFRWKLEIFSRKTKNIPPPPPFPALLSRQIVRCDLLKLSLSTENRFAKQQKPSNSKHSTVIKSIFWLLGAFRRLFLSFTSF